MNRSHELLKQKISQYSPMKILVATLHFDLKMDYPTGFARVSFVLL